MFHRTKTFAKELFKKRENHFAKSGITLDDDTLNDATIAAVLEKFPEHPSDEQVSKLWNHFQSIKSFTRNEAGPTYKKRRGQKVSGTYNDTDILWDILKAGSNY